ncbi:MAG: hypothetical protein HGA19_11175, partial [Oscillochloris sp.]|nr:hypothetical protein [Oscillochloris sp.]
MLLALLIALLAISCVAQLALYIAAPHIFWYHGDLAAKGRVDYGYWGDVPLLPALNPQAIAAPGEDSDQSIGNLGSGDSVPVAVIPEPDQTL